MTLCDECRHKKAVTMAGKVICVKRGTKHPRARKCKRFDKKVNAYDGKRD